MTPEHDHEPPTCALCADRTDLVRQMVEWSHPLALHEGQTPLRFELVFRCTDRATCRARLEAAGRPWPVIDTTPSPRESVASGSR